MRQYLFLTALILQYRLLQWILQTKLNDPIFFSHPFLWLLWLTSGLLFTASQGLPSDLDYRDFFFLSGPDFFNNICKWVMVAMTLTEKS